MQHRLASLSHRIASYRIALHRPASHRHRIASPRIAAYCFALHGCFARTASHGAMVGLVSTFGGASVFMASASFGPKHPHREGTAHFRSVFNSSPHRAQRATNAMYGDLLLGHERLRPRHCLLCGRTQLHKRKTEKRARAVARRCCKADEQCATSIRGSRRSAVPSGSR